jgi:hypothetical protein
MEKPHLLLFQHVQSQRSTKRNWSYGVSVRHQVFGYQYLKYALPKCATLPSFHSTLPLDHRACCCWLFPGVSLLSLDICTRRRGSSLAEWAFVRLADACTGPSKVLPCQRSNAAILPFLTC